jgi:hypothetical protein
VTVTGNSAGNGGSAGTGTGGAGGSGASHIGPPPTVGGTGGTGGNGTGGTGGYGGNGGGVRVANLALSQSTLSANAAGAAAAGAAGTGGAGGPGGPASGSNTKGADGPGGSGSGGAAGQSGAGGAIQTPTTATITSSILASNTPTNCAGSVGDGGYNIDFPESSCPGAAVDPLLSGLTANGGPTATQPLGAGSPAIDLVPVGPACSATDQTGHSRPVGADCDAGAHEVAPPAASTGAPQRNAMTGMVTPNLRVTRYHFEYGSTTTYGSATPDRGAGAGATPLPVTATAMGLVPGATYHYRLVATSTDGTATGVDRTLVAEDTVAPVLSHLSLTRSVFAVGPKATAIMARKRRGARGTTFRFTLSEAAGVKIAIQRAAKGRRNGKRCVKPSPKLRKAKKCTRYAGAGTLTRKGKAGANKVPFSGRIGPRPLPPGRYRAVLRATDAAGNRSKPKTVAFRIVRP